MVSQKGKDSPVYEVKPERGTERGRILHRNMLMPCNALPLQEPVQSMPGGQYPRIQQRKRHKEYKSNETSKDKDSSDEEECYWANRLRHYHNQPGEQNVAPSITPETEAQPELDAEAQEFRMETPIQTLVDNDCAEYVTTGYDTQEVTQTAQSVDLPSPQELEPPDTQPRRSQRERRPRETLTYESLGQPTHRVVGLHTDPLYVNTVASAYGQYGVLWLPHSCLEHI